MIVRGMIVAGLVAVLALVGWSVATRERLLASGARVVLELAPRDPRSLMQGDYMRLDYDIARTTPHEGWPRDGAIIVRADRVGAFRFVRRDDGSPVLEGEHRLTYRLRGQALRIGTDAFYFQEGTGDAYAPARYGELRVADDGTAVLTGLLDDQLKPITPP